MLFRQPAPAANPQHLLDASLKFCAFVLQLYISFHNDLKSGVLHAFMGHGQPVVLIVLKVALQLASAPY